MVLSTIALAACASDPQPTGDPAPPPILGEPEGCSAPPDAAQFDFFGEACTAAPYPANTACRSNDNGDRGWCIGPDSGGVGVCRPMAYSPGRCPSCPAGTQRYARAGAAYCAP